MGRWDGASRIVRAQDAAQRPEILRERWVGVAARVLQLDDEQRLRMCDGEAIGAATSGDLPSDAVYLGVAEGHDWFATHSELAGNYLSLRSMVLSAAESHLAFRAAALLGWHRLALPCERCGGVTAMATGGAFRLCTDCDAAAFARVEPAVIVAVLDPDDRLFLAHQDAWATGRVSILAGFIEAGESAEQTCHREVLEESALTISALRYVGSQPWPFPRSLMLGFVARTNEREGAVDGVELDWGRFFTRDEYTRLSAEGVISGPGTTSMAHRIVSAWVHRRLEPPEPVVFSSVD